MVVFFQKLLKTSPNRLVNEPTVVVREKGKNNAGAGEGFTLVEILVVVAILVVLTAVAVPIFLGQKEKAERAVIETKVAVVAATLANGRAVGGDARVVNGIVVGDYVTGGSLEVLFNDSFPGSLDDSLSIVGLGNDIYIKPAYDEQRTKVEDYCVMNVNSTYVVHMNQGHAEPQVGPCI